LPLHYRLMMEEDVVRYDNIVNNVGFKRPQEDGEWIMWQKYRRDRRRGRIYDMESRKIQDAQYNTKKKTISALEGRVFKIAFPGYGKKFTIFDSGNLLKDFQEFFKIWVLNNFSNF